jgi:Tfp pilus assembly protein PilO
MSINESKITLPSWLVNTMLPIIITILSYFFITGKQMAVIEQTVKMQQTQIEELKANKADAKTIEYISNQINRIEQKLDDLQLNKKDKK